MCDMRDVFQFTTKNYINAILICITETRYTQCVSKDTWKYSQNHLGKMQCMNSAILLRICIFLGLSSLHFDKSSKHVLFQLTFYPGTILPTDVFHFQTKFLCTITVCWYMNLPFIPTSIPFTTIFLTDSEQSCINSAGLGYLQFFLLVHL